VKRVSLAAALGALCYLVLLPASGSLAAAAGVPGSVTFHGTRGHAMRVTLSPQGVSGLSAVSSALGGSFRI